MKDCVLDKDFLLKEVPPKNGKSGGLTNGKIYVESCTQQIEDYIQEYVVA